MFNKKNLFVFLSCFLASFFFSFSVDAATISERLSGKIVLQVEEKGEAYYINPVDLKGYYLGRPSDAFSIMRSLGLGATNYDIDRFLSARARTNLSGRILLQVEDKGQAYYVNPSDLKLHYLGRPEDAFAVMRNLGLGIKNSDLDQIELVGGDYFTGQIGDNLPGQGEKLVRFLWKYDNKDYYLNYVFSDNLYLKYKGSDKNYYYPASNPPSNPREKYYSVFFKTLDGDNTLDLILKDLRKIADIDNLNETEFVEFVAAFVQYIPYDFSKLPSDEQNFAYETLYENKGVCSDFTILLVMMFQKLGYGTAIFDYPDSKHTATAIECSEKQVHDSPYCFVETTNYFPIGIFPSNFTSGKARFSSMDWKNVFKPDVLGDVEIYHTSRGKIYTGITETATIVDSIIKMEESLEQKNAEIRALHSQLTSSKEELDQLLVEIKLYQDMGDSESYNDAISTYNSKVIEYNELLDNYNLKSDIYNLDLNLLERTRSDFLQSN
jgi:ribosomal protein L30/L7E